MTTDCKGGDYDGTDDSRSSGGHDNSGGRLCDGANATTTGQCSATAQRAVIYRPDPNACWDADTLVVAQCMRVEEYSRSGTRGWLHCGLACYQD